MGTEVSFAKVQDLIADDANTVALGQPWEENGVTYAVYKAKSAFGTDPSFTGDANRSAEYGTWSKGSTGMVVYVDREANEVEAVTTTNAPEGAAVGVVAGFVVDGPALDTKVQPQGAFATGELVVVQLDGLMPAIFNSDASENDAVHTSTSAGKVDDTGGTVIQNAVVAVGDVDESVNDLGWLYVAPGMRAVVTIS